MTKRITIQQLSKKIDSMLGEIQSLQNNVLNNSEFEVGDKVCTRTYLRTLMHVSLYKTNYVITKKEFKIIIKKVNSGFPFDRPSRQKREGIIYTVVNTDTGSIEEKHENDLYKKGWF